MAKGKVKNTKSTVVAKQDTTAQSVVEFPKDKTKGEHHIISLSGELVSQKPSFNPVQTVEVKFNILGDTQIVYFTIDDEKAVLSNEDKSKVRSAIVNTLKSIDGNWIFNKESADKANKELSSKLVELKILESKLKVEQRARNLDKEKLDRIPGIVKTIFGV